MFVIAFVGIDAINIYNNNELMIFYNNNLFDD